MEWIRRNPKSAAGLAALMALLLVVLVWGLGGSDSPGEDEPTLGAPLGTPTPTRAPLTVLPTPSGVPTSVDEMLNAFPSGASTSGAFGASGSSKSLTRHRVTVTARSDGPMMAVGWWIPFADGERKGGEKGPGRSYQHSDGTYGDADLARVLAYGGPNSRRTWCTVTVDGKVTERQEADGPYAQVFCQG